MNASALTNLASAWSNISKDDLEVFGVIKRNAVGGSDWKRFNADPMTFILKLDNQCRERLAGLLSEMLMTISPYSEADDDKIFALTCARKNARTDVDAAAIAWAEEEIEALRRERDEAVSQLNQSYGERMLPGAPGPRLDP